MGRSAGGQKARRAKCRHVCTLAGLVKEEEDEIQGKERTNLVRMSVRATWRVLQEGLGATPPFWQGLALSWLLSSPVVQEVVERQDQPPEYSSFDL